MTPAQKIQLKEMAKHKTGYVPQDHNFGCKRRSCEKLIEQGLARQYVHGGYEITDAGREALSKIEDGKPE